MTSQELSDCVEPPKAGGPDSPLPASYQEENITASIQPHIEVSDSPQQKISALPGVYSLVSVTQSGNSYQEQRGIDIDEDFASPVAPNLTPIETPPVPRRDVVFRRSEERDRNGNVTVTEVETFITPDGHQYTISNVIRKTSIAIPRAESEVSVAQSQDLCQGQLGNDTETVSSPAPPNTTPTEQPLLPGRNVVFTRNEERDRNSSATVIENETFITPEENQHTISHVSCTTSNSNSTSGGSHGSITSNVPLPNSEIESAPRRTAATSNDARSLNHPRSSTQTRSSNHTRSQIQTPSTRNTLHHPVTSVDHLRVSGQQFTTVQLMTVVGQFQNPDMPISTFLELITEELKTGRMVAGHGPELFKFDHSHPGNVMRARDHEGDERNASVQELINNYTPMYAWY